MGSIAKKLQKLVDTKEAIKNAIIAKGVEVSNDDKFSLYPGKILEISSGGIGENLLAGTYSENVIGGEKYAEYASSGDITIVDCLIEATRIDSSTTDISNVLPNLKTAFDNNLSYTTELVTINEQSYLKLYKKNLKNAFLISCESNSGSTITITIKVMINDSISDEVFYQRKYIRYITTKYVYLSLNFIKTAQGEIWGIGDVYKDFAINVNNQENIKKTLCACSIVAENIATGEETYLHCLSDSNSEDDISFLKFSDNSTDFTNSLAEKTANFVHYASSDYIILEYLYFYSENLKTDNLFVAKSFPERNEAMSFAMNGNEFFSSETSLGEQAKFVFLK